MSLPLLVLRPEPGCGETLAAARARGLQAIAAPLFAIEPVAWDVPDPAHFDALLAGSANAFRHGGAGLAGLSALSVHAVGEATADAARAAGFRVAGLGEGRLKEVLDAVPAPARLLRLAGEARVALVPRPGVTVVERVVYRADHQPLSGEAAAAIGRGAVALLHSGEAARAFASECDRLRIDRGTVALAALAPRVAEAAGSGWREVGVAPAIADPALLALAADMCQ